LLGQRYFSEKMPDFSDDAQRLGVAGHLNADLNPIFMSLRHKTVKILTLALP